MLKTLIGNIKKHDFFRYNLIFFIGSMAIAVLNYIYYPIIGRLVSVSDFGEVQATISIFTQLGIILTAFGYTVTNIINNEIDRQNSKIVILELERVVMIITTVLFVLLCVGGSYLRTGLQFSSIVPFVLVGILVLLNVPSMSRTFILQGQKKLVEVSFSGIIFASSKLVLSVILIMLGVDIIAVMISYIVAQIITLLYLSAKTKNDFVGLLGSLKHMRSRVLTSAQRLLINKELVFGGVIFLLLSTIAISCSFDVVVVRFFLSAHDSGAYSGISTIARIIYFLTVSVSGVLLATVKSGESFKNAKKALFRSFMIVVALGGSVLIAFAISPVFFTELLMGAGYSSYAYLLPAAGLMMLISSVNNLLVCFQIARRQKQAVFAVFIGVAVLAALLTIYHNGFLEIIFSYVISNTTIFAVLLIQIIRKGLRGEKEITIDSIA